MEPELHRQPPTVAIPEQDLPPYSDAADALSRAQIRNRPTALTHLHQAVQVCDSGWAGSHDASAQ
jgi:hypothetical protein